MRSHIFDSGLFLHHWGRRGGMGELFCTHDQTCVQRPRHPQVSIPISYCAQQPNLIFI